MSNLTPFEAPVVVTGAGQGIGAACARCAAAAGAPVVLMDLDGDNAVAEATAIAQTGGAAVGLRGDVTQPDDVATMFDVCRDRFGPAGAVIHAAGGMAGAPPAAIADLDLADVERVVRLNLLGSFAVIQAAARAFAADPAPPASGRSIVLVASLQGVVGSARLAPYGASKAGVIHLVKTAALELAAAGVRVNAVAPTITETPAVQLMVDAERRAASEQAIPLGRIAQPTDIASAAVYLASTASSFVTGQLLVLDGGLSLTTARPGRR